MSAADVLLSFGANAFIAGIPLALGLAAALRLDGTLHPRARWGAALLAFFAIPALAIAVSADGPAPAAAEPVRVVASSSEPGATGVVTWSFPQSSGAATIWIAVALVLVVRELGGHALLRRRSQAFRSVDLREAGVDTAVLVAPSGVPMTIGLVRPRIVLPERAIRELTASTLASIVAHEASHARWRDPLAQAVIRLARALMWPIVPLHLIGGLVSREAEAAADLAACERGDAPGYAATLVEAAGWRSGAASAVAPSFTGTGLESRVRRLLDGRRRDLAGPLAAGAVLLIAGAITGATPVVRPDNSASFAAPHRLAPAAVTAPASGAAASIREPKSPGQAPVAAVAVPLPQPGVAEAAADDLHVSDELERLTESLPGVSRELPPSPAFARFDEPPAFFAPVTSGFDLPDTAIPRPPDNDRIVIRDENRIVIRAVIRDR